jgi:hypothetical protein
VQAPGAFVVGCGVCERPGCLHPGFVWLGNLLTSVETLAIVFIHAMERLVSHHDAYLRHLAAGGSKRVFGLGIIGNMLRVTIKTRRRRVGIRGGLKERNR